MEARTTSDILVALDIGTTKICAIVGKRNEFGKIEVLGIGKAESLGVMRGVVANIEKTVTSIQKAVKLAGDMAGVEIKIVHVGIAGKHINSLQHRGILVRKNQVDEISKLDIQDLINDMHALVLPPGEKIIHVLPQEFIVDNEPNIKDPVGMSGVRLEANFHIITGKVSAAQNIFRCVEKSNLSVDDLVLEPIASAASVLSDEEKEMGVALVDIGGGTTDLAIFQEGFIRHTAVIPFGGNIITEDIKSGCMIMQKQAEMLKVKFGSALSNENMRDEIVVIPGIRGRDKKEISVYNLANIIQARIEEIFDYVNYEIKRSGYERSLIGGIVITGGGSMLKHIKQLVQYMTGMDVRLGLPTEHLSGKIFAEDLRNPIYATGIGLLIKGFEELDYKRSIGVVEENKHITTEVQEEEKIPKAEKKTGALFEKLFKKSRSWFEEEEDKEYFN